MASGHGDATVGALAGVYARLTHLRGNLSISTGVFGSLARLASVQNKLVFVPLLRAADDLVWRF